MTNINEMSPKVRVIIIKIIFSLSWLTMIILWNSHIYQDFNIISNWKKVKGEIIWFDKNSGNGGYYPIVEYDCLLWKKNRSKSGKNQVFKPTIWKEIEVYCLQSDSGKIVINSFYYKYLSLLSIIFWLWFLIIIFRIKDFHFL